MIIFGKDKFCKVTAIMINCAYGVLSFIKGGRDMYVRAIYLLSQRDRKE